MGVLGESWCFCNGGGKSERMKGSIFCSKGSAMARVFSGSGFLIHRNLLLTTHINLPSVTVAEGAEIWLQDNVAAKLVPHRFFITSPVLDLTIVGLDAMDVESTAQGQQPHFLKTCSNPTLDLGSIVYLLGHTDKKELTVGEGKVVIATDNLIKLSTDGVTWSPGSAGFDVQGNLAFMVCDPMKLASSPTTKSSSTSTSSSSSWKKDHPMQFGIPIPIICDWLNQHWEGSLDELNKPKLPLIRLMSAGQKSEHSCASFTLRRVFKSTEGENDETPSSSHIVSRPRDQAGPSCSANICQDETPVPGIHHEQGIPTPEIYESRKLTSVPSQKKENSHIQLLDINFPPKVSKSIVLPLSIKHLPPNSDENVVKEPTFNKPSREENIGQNVVEGPASKKSPKEQNILKDRGQADRDTDTDADADADAEIISTGSVNGDHSEVQSSSYPVDASNFQYDLDDFHGDYSSEGETTMYSAETMESRNYTSPREEKFQQVGRSQSCVNYNRWGSTRRNPVARKSAFDKHQSFNQGRKTYSQGAASQRSHDYYSPTVSSIMKKRNSSEPQISKPRQSTVQLSPRWV